MISLRNYSLRFQCCSVASQPKCNIYSAFSSLLSEFIPLGSLPILAADLTTFQTSRHWPTFQIPHGTHDFTSSVRNSSSRNNFTDLQQKPINVAARSPVPTVFYGFNIGNKGSNPTQNIDICPFCLCVCLFACRCRPRDCRSHILNALLYQMSKKGSQLRKLILNCNRFKGIICKRKNAEDCINQSSICWI
jgi:hypothetical protein